MGIVAHHTFGKIGGRLGLDIILIDVRIGTYHIVGTYFGFGYIEYFLAIITPNIVFITTGGFLRTIVGESLQEVCLCTSGYIFDKDMVVSSFVPLIPMAMV